MPWKINKSGNKFVVIKDDGSGKVVGTHDSRKKAMSQVRALYASEAVKA